MLNGAKKERLVILTIALYVYSRLDRDASKKMYGLLSATIRMQVTMCVALELWRKLTVGNIFKLSAS